MNVKLLLLLAATAANAWGDAVKIAVDRTGFHVVTGEQLQGAGIQLDTVDPAQVGLRCGPDAVAVRIVGLDNGRLAAGSQIIFHGTALDTRYTGTNVYWLSFDGQHVARMKEVEPVAAEGEPDRSFPASLHLEENKTYAYLMGDPQDGELRPWFWGLVKEDGPLEAAFDLPHLADPQAPATLRIAVRGRTSNPAVDPDHHLLLAVNGVQVGEARLDGAQRLVLEHAIPPGTLNKGRNTAALSCAGDTGPDSPDQTYLDWVEVEYQRDFAADEPALEITVAGEGRRTVEVTGIEADAADWYDLSDPLHPGVAPALPVADGRLRVAAEAATGTRYAIVVADGYVPAESVLKAPTPYLKEEGLGADYLIIAHDSLLDATARLAEHRRSQGLRVEVVPVSQVYNEFSDGVFTPHAIRDFVSHTIAHWDPPPRYLLLVGDATYDYRDYQGNGFRNLVPSMMVRERGTIEVAADSAFAIDDETGVLRLAIGRFPASQPVQVEKLTETTIKFEQSVGTSADQRKIVFAADQEGFGQLKHRFDQICNMWSEEAARAGYLVEKFYQTSVGLTEDQDRNARIAKTREALTPGLVQSLIDGPYAIFFSGHGDEYFWGYYKLLMADDLGEIQASSPSISIQDTCFAGAFDCPGGRDSIAEAMLWSGVSAACYAPSRLGGNDIQGQLLRHIVQGDVARLGQAILEARQRRPLHAQDGFWASGSNFNLLGDPALILAGEGLQSVQ